MYCEHCGKKIDTDSNFCEHCGEKVIKKEQKIKKRTSKENKIILLVILFCAFVFLFIIELKHFNSPENAMNNYMRNIKNQNYDTILNNLQIESSKFTSKDILTQLELEDFQIESFKVLSCNLIDSNTAECSVSYKNKKNGFIYEKTYQLIKSNQKRLWIFTNWNIENNVKTIKNWKLYVPQNATVLLANQEITEYLSNESEKDGFDCYIIPELFQGEYDLKITINDKTTLNKTISITKSSYVYEFELEDIPKEIKEEMVQLGTDLIGLIYQNAIQKKDFESLESSYDITNLKDDYNALQKELENTNLTKIKINDIKVMGIESTKNGKLKITYHMNYEYDLKIITDGKETTHHSSSNDTFYITVKTIELKEIEKLDSLVTYFSKKY